MSAPMNSAPSRWFHTAAKEDTGQGERAVIICFLLDWRHEEMQCFAQARSKSVAEPEALRMSLVFEPKYPPLPLPGQGRVK